MLEWKDSLRKEYIDGKESIKNSLLDRDDRPLVFANLDSTNDSDIYSDLCAINHKLNLITDAFSKMADEKIYFYIARGDSILTAYCCKQKEAYIIVLDVDTAIYLRYRIRQFYGERQSVSLPGGLSIRVDQIIYSTYLYIYFHELAHVIRGHLDYPAKDSDPRLGTEYDADIMGAYLTYKNLGAIVQLSNIDAKVLTLLGIYWTFRTLDVHHRGVSKATKYYPSGISRIYLAFKHLSLFDYREGDIETLIKILEENEHIVSISRGIVKRKKRLLNYIKSSKAEFDFAKFSKAKDEAILKFKPFRMTKLEV